jgi:hypothetical protein
MDNVAMTDCATVHESYGRNVALKTGSWLAFESLQEADTLMDDSRANGKSVVEFALRSDFGDPMIV